MTVPTTHTYAWKSSPWLIASILTVLLFVTFRSDIFSHPRALSVMFPDNPTYFQMAQGDTAHVVAPFTRRALYPFLAHCLSVTSSLPLRTAFILLDISSAFLLIYFLARILVLFGLSPWIVAVFILTPSSIDRIDNDCMPDLFHAALIAFFFLLALQKKFLPALIVLAIAYMTRESTLLICLAFGIIAWLRNLRAAALGSGVVLLFGIAFGSWAVRQGQPNIHRLPDFLYFALKLPHQFLKNVFGFRIWTNTLPFGEPFHKFVLPDYLRSGDVKVIGLCYPELQMPLFTLVTLLTLFGTGPLIIWMTRRLKLWTALHPIGIQVAFVYGLIAYLIGTSVGDGVDRLIGYGWPLFWIVVPYIFAIAQQHKNAAFIKWSLISSGILPWIPPLLGYTHDSLYYDNLFSIYIGLLTLLLALLVYGKTWRELRGIKVTFDPRQPILKETAS